MNVDAAGSQHFPGFNDAVHFRTLPWPQTNSMQLNNSRLSVGDLSKSYSDHDEFGAAWITIWPPNDVVTTGGRCWHMSIRTAFQLITYF